MKNKTLEGIIKITAKPLGFVQIEDRENDPIIFEEDLNCALNRDRVEIEIIGKDRDKDRARVVKILERARTRFVGTIEKSPDGFVVAADDFKFYRPIDIGHDPESRNENIGFKALVEIEEWNNSNKNPKGKVLSIIGKKGLHETEMQSILLGRGIIYNFPEKVEKEAQEVAEKEGANMEEEAKGRKDFRNKTTFTIDPVDAKDFDDALSYEEIDGETIRVGVHIADVSHFVRPGGELDKEARKREFSTYLVDRTIPMLPEILSNGLCSLNPNVDRLAFGAVFDIDRKSGEIKDRWFGKTIINSDKRFTYEEAQNILDTGSGNFEHELSELNRIAKIYKEKNKKNGAIEFETEEVKFVLDEEGRPIKVYKKPRLDTMKMIEEWMLLANKEVARFISKEVEKNGGAGLFRIHDNPNVDKIEALSIFVRALGYELDMDGEGGITGKDINALLKKIEGHASESLIKTAAVRSMAKAAYSPKNIGHFGLAFQYYTHFTSPIRRYPDLVVHRILERRLNNEAINKDEFAIYSQVAEDASEKEISVAEAERESVRYKQVEYMMNKIGEEFEGVISGVTEWGIYVEEPETKSEGMVRLKDIGNDFYSLDEKNYCIIGERTKKKFSLGDKVKVKLVSADLDRKTLDFKMI